MNYNMSISQKYIYLKSIIFKCLQLVLLHNVSMGYLLKSHYVRVDQDLLTTLMERWSKWINNFHLPIEEITIIPEDIHRILHVSVKGHPIYMEEGLTMK